VPWGRSRREGLVRAAVVLGVLRSVRVHVKEVGRRKEKKKEKEGKEKKKIWKKISNLKISEK
jgi:hypothetical protein